MIAPQAMQSPADPVAAATSRTPRSCREESFEIRGLDDVALDFENQIITAVFGAHKRIEIRPHVHRRVRRAKCFTNERFHFLGQATLMRARTVLDQSLEVIFDIANEQIGHGTPLDIIDITLPGAVSTRRLLPLRASPP